MTEEEANILEDLGVCPVRNWRQEFDVEIKGKTTATTIASCSIGNFADSFGVSSRK